jgi:hypothetical protein
VHAQIERLSEIMRYYGAVASEPWECKKGNKKGNTCAWKAYTIAIACRTGVECGNMPPEYC